MDKIKTQCLDCKRETNHGVVATKLYDTYFAYEYHRGKEYSIVQCLGCDQVSFLKTDHDYEAVYQTGYNDNDYEHERSFTNYYPDASEVLSKFKRLLPKKLYEIYSETKLAFTQNLFIFTAIGIRAIIECICKNKNVRGNNLEKKISNLQSLGDVSKRDVDLLHSLRFLGNDAVHELEIPGIQDIKVAFNIIEHLIQSIYIMPNDLKNTNFKIYIDEYEKFEKIIIENINNELFFNNELNFSAKKLISPNGITSKENLIQFEDQLKNRISSGDLDWIQVSQNINSNDENNSINETFYKIIKVP